MITFYGNEIKLASDRLSYRLYETNWIDRSQAVKKNILIFGEILMRPKELIVLKLYPLTLETFTMVMIVKGRKGVKYFIKYVTIEREI